MKTFALMICDEKDFLRKRGKMIKVISLTHNDAMDQFLDNYEDEMIGLTVMTLCFEEQEQWYGYRYSVNKGQSNHESSR